MEAKLSDFIRVEIGERNISAKEVEIFIKWVNVNKYTLEQAKKICLRLFKRGVIGSSSEIFMANEAKEYAQFKGTVRETDID